MYDFEFEIECDDDTEMWSITFKNMKERDFDEWVVLIMKLRDWLIEKEIKNGNSIK